MDSDETKIVSKDPDNEDNHVSDNEKKPEKIIPKWETVIDLSDGECDY